MVMYDKTGRVTTNPDKASSRYTKPSNMPKQSGSTPSPSTSKDSGKWQAPTGVWYDKTGRVTSPPPEPQQTSISTPSSVSKDSGQPILKSTKTQSTLSPAEARIKGISGGEKGSEINRSYVDIGQDIIRQNKPKPRFTGVSGSWEPKDKDMVKGSASVGFRFIAPGISEQVETKDGKKKIIQESGVGAFIRAGGTVKLGEPEKRGGIIKPVVGFETIPPTYAPVFNEQNKIIGVKPKGKSYVDIGQGLLYQSRLAARPQEPGRFGRTFLDPEGQIRAERRIREREIQLYKESGKLPKFDVPLMVYGAQRDIYKELSERPGTAAAKFGIGMLLGGGSSLFLKTGILSPGALEIAGAAASGIFITATGYKAGTARSPAEAGGILGKAGLDVALIGGGAVLGSKIVNAFPGQTGTVRTHTTRQYVKDDKIKINVEKGTITSKKGDIIRYDVRSEVSKDKGQGTYRAIFKDIKGKIIDVKTGSIEQSLKLRQGKEQDLFKFSSKIKVKPAGSLFATTETRTGEIMLLGKDSPAGSRLSFTQLEKSTSVKTTDLFFKDFGGALFTETGQVSRIGKTILQAEQIKGFGITKVTTDVKKSNLMSSMMADKKGQILGIPQPGTGVAFVPEVGTGAALTVQTGPDLGGLISLPSPKSDALIGSIGLLPGLFAPKAETMPTGIPLGAPGVLISDKAISQAIPSYKSQLLPGLGVEAGYEATSKAGLEVGTEAIPLIETIPEAITFPGGGGVDFGVIEPALEVPLYGDMMLPFGGGGRRSGGRKGRKRAGFKTDYFASIEAVAFDIKGPKPSKSALMTGIFIRPKLR